MTVPNSDLVRQYYDALDNHEYDRLETLLTPGFVQHRPDRTFEDRAAFVQFMQTGRPNPETSHELVTVVTDDTGAAARGRVIDTPTDRSLFEFADFFEFDGDRICRLDTYSR